MRRYIFVLLLSFVVGFSSQAQEINCSVKVNAEQTGRTKLSIFNTLESALQEFVSENSWTKLDLQEHEKINCNIFINITSYDSNNFKATLQIQSSRPIFGSVATTPVFNFKDNDFDFEYTEYQNLDYSPNTFNSNLVSGISFYIYTILGLDADTFAPQGGQAYYEEARQIVNTAQQSNYEGWRAGGNNKSRFRLNSDLLSNNFTGYRDALYTYHRLGLDKMHEDVEEGKQKIAEAILALKQVNNTRPNSLLIRTFFDAKADEIEKIFSGGPSIPITEVVETLNRIAPLYSKNWSSIKY